MTDEFVIRWDIDNPAVTLANGRAESEVFNERGFKWTIAVEEEPSYPGWEKFTLRCDAGNARDWKCEAKLEMLYLLSNGQFRSCKSTRLCFNAANHSLSFGGIFNWIRMKNGSFSVNNKISLEFRVTILSSKREEPIVDPGTFAAPSRRSDVILKIGDKQLHVSKEYLAVQSPVFEALFFGEFAEKGKEEIELKDIVYEEFLDLLHVIYLENVKLTDHTVLHILKLADQFRVERVLNLSVEHVTQSKGIDAVKKLLVADQYNLDSLKDQCINSLVSEHDPMGKLKASPEYDHFSVELKVTIFDRLVKK